MKHFICWSCLFMMIPFYQDVNAFLVVPDEVPSILSVLYSNLPPIKKGTDSRLGFGFRIGPNADVQVQLEIGPQTNTQPIGPPPDGSSSTSKKRQIVSKNKGVPLLKYNNSNSPNTTSETWLKNWKLAMMGNEIPASSSMQMQTIPSQSLQESHESEDLEKTSDPTKEEDVEFVNRLRQLYKMSQEQNTNSDKF